MATAAADAPAPGALAPVACRVLGRHRETHDTVTLEVERPPGFAFAPGQFNMLYAFPVGEVAISISGDPDGDGPLVHTVRDVGLVSHALAETRRDGWVGVRGPFGRGWPVTEAEGGDVVLVAGGVGLPPLRPVIYHVLAHRDRYHRVALLYGARAPEEMVFTRELAAWRSRFDIDVAVTVDTARGGWAGNVGVVPSLVPRAQFDARSTTAMVCGPEIMMRFAVTALGDRGVSVDRIFLSMERNMRCGVGFCGHCQLGPEFICKDGPVFPYSEVSRWFGVREL